MKVLAGKQVAALQIFHVEDLIRSTHEADRAPMKCADTLQKQVSDALSASTIQSRSRLAIDDLEIESLTFRLEGHKQGT